MKNFDSRTYSINDFLEWQSNNQLELSPKFQRKSVWSETGKSFLMDTIVRGLPIPKVFIRQKINVTTRTSVREVVDGQQRLRTILSFINDGFKISPKHNSIYGGYYFSELAQIDDEIQASILNYEISVDLLVNMPDSEVLDVFSRLNSYAVTLNDQEKINANHFSAFKLLADELAKKYYTFWVDNKILSEQKIVRMEDVNFTADILIACLEGVKEKKKIKTYYDLYELDFEHDVNLLQTRFSYIMDLISELYPHTLKNTEFRRVHLFYSLFLSLYHILYGLPNEERIYTVEELNPVQKDRIRNRLDHVDHLFELVDINNGDQMSAEEKVFMDACRRATTDASRRRIRMNYIINLVRDDCN